MTASAGVVTKASDVSTNLLKLESSRRKPRPVTSLIRNAGGVHKWIYVVLTSAA